MCNNCFMAKVNNYDIAADREAQDSLQRIINRHTIAPIRSKTGDRELLGRMLLRAMARERDAVTEFYRHWTNETGIAGMQDLFASEDSDFYLIFHPLCKTDECSLAVGALEMSSATENPRLEWIWVHPNFRKGLSPKYDFAAETLHLIRDLHPDMTVNLGDSENPANSFKRLWERAFPGIDIPIS